MKKIFISALALAVGACGLFERNSSNYWLNHMHNYSTYPIYYYASNSSEPEKMTESSEFATHVYKRNVVVSANIGQRMVDSHTFKINRFTGSKVIAQQDAMISNTGNEVYVHKGQEFVPFGEVNIDGQYYVLVEGDDQGSVLMIDEAGYVQNRICTVYRGELLFSKFYASINPEGLKIGPINTSRTAVDGPKQNFEIRYDGSQNGIAEMTYIGYEQKGNAYAQKYQVPQGQKLININGVKIKITDVYPDRIEYMLLD